MPDPKEDPKPQDPPADPKPVEGDPKPVPPAKEPTSDPAQDPQATLKGISETVNKIADTVAKQGEAITSIQSQGVPTRAPEVPEKKAWTLDELREMDEKIDAGEMDTKYRSWISEKRTELVANNVANKAHARANLQMAWKGSMSKAANKWPDLNDANSDHYKLAQQYLLSDPAYKRYTEMAKNGIQDIDTDIIDPDLQYKCAKQAKLDLIEKEEAKPNKGKPSSKTALSGKTLPVVEEGLLEKLEAEAVKTGDPQDWSKLFRERERVKHAQPA